MKMNPKLNMYQIISYSSIDAEYLFVLAESVDEASRIAEAEGYSSFIIEGYEDNGSVHSELLESTSPPL